MTYTVNGKKYSKYDINKRCAEIQNIGHKAITDTDCPFVVSYVNHSEYNPCIDPSDTDAIIDKVWDELMVFDPIYEEIKWEYIIRTYKCDKLTAACICFIETSEWRTL